MPQCFTLGAGTRKAEPVGQEGVGVPSLGMGQFQRTSPARSLDIALALDNGDNEFCPGDVWTWSGNDRSD